MPGILIADDNESIRHLLRSFAESKTKFPVCGEAANGTEVIEKAQQLQPDLVLLDLSMPLLNGAEAASVLKRMMPQTKIVVFTVHGADIGNALVAATGIDLVLTKADCLLKLHEHLNALLTPAVDTQTATNVPLAGAAIPN
jgi:DNA-binding NarL/FixJ family response regulator